MTIWEKVDLLDMQYRRAREQLLLKQCDSVEIIIQKEPPKPKKNATKPSTKNNSQ